MRKLQKWVKEYGVEKLALKLGVSSFAVRYWTSRKGIPRVPIMRALVKLSKGVLTIEDVINDSYPDEVGE